MVERSLYYCCYHYQLASWFFPFFINYYFNGYFYQTPCNPPKMIDHHIGGVRSYLPLVMSCILTSLVALPVFLASFSFVSFFTCTYHSAPAFLRNYYYYAQNSFFFYIEFMTRRRGYFLILFFRPVQFILTVIHVCKCITTHENIM